MRSDKRDESLNSLLKRVDEWKFKLHDEVKNLTIAEKLEYWRRAHEEARVMGLNVVEPGAPIKPRKKRSRKTG